MFWLASLGQACETGTVGIGDGDSVIVADAGVGELC